MTGDTRTSSYNRRTVLRTTGATVAAGTVGLAGCFGSSSTTLTFGIVPAEDNMDIVEQWGPVGDHVQENTDADIEFFEATSYSGIIESMANDNVDIAWYGPFAYVLAHERADAEAILIQKDGETGNEAYQTFWTTYHDDITGIDDMEGRSVVFADPASTSGYLIPNYMVLQDGYDPNEFFSETSFAGGHSSAQLTLANEQIDVAPSASFVYRNMVENGDISSDHNRVIVESEPIPLTPIAVHPDIEDDLRTQLVDGFTSFDDEETLEALSTAGWTETDDSEYDVIRDVQSTLEEAGFEVGL